ncbi:hypothetical protein [Amycolatopsis sp. 195334CR]|uniref:hypothetical protein n=1 Tax=Amycolatopsis sp. 195334CR TaxID=2814588 RepID=UPI001A8C6B4B|nr:hypothetical protein [Amycolatopsis sp. 195334CR]MBN6039987.1 hypothetical protein [Amycolatopsis sp. 195334CR]
MTAGLTRTQKEDLAWELQVAIVNGLGGEGGPTAFGNLGPNEVHPELGITWNQAMQQIAVWLNRLPGGVRHEQLLFARTKARNSATGPET